MGFLFHYTIERTLSDETITSEEISTTTTSWWKRTFPITETRTARPRSKPPIKTTTIPVRVPRIISITVPATLFGVTIVFGFGFIIFALITHGNGVSFLTRTNSRRLR